MELRIGGLENDRSLKAFGRFIEPSQVGECGAAVAVSMRVIRIELDRVIKALHRLRETIEIRQRVAPIVVDLSVVGKLGKRSIVICQGIFKSFERDVSITAIVEALGILRLQQDRTIVGCDRSLHAVQAKKGVAAIIVKSSIFWIEFYGKGELTLGQIELAALQMSDAERIDRIEIFRLYAQDGAVNFFGGIQLPALVQGKRLLKFGLWIAHLDFKRIASDSDMVSSLFMEGPPRIKWRRRRDSNPRYGYKPV